MRVLVLGVSGMLGSVVFRVLSARSDFETFGAARSSVISRYFPSAHGKRIEWGVDAENADALARLLGRIRPAAMINCVGVVKQLASANDPLITIPSRQSLQSLPHAAYPYQHRLRL